MSVMIPSYIQSSNAIQRFAGWLRDSAAELKANIIGNHRIA